MGIYAILAESLRYPASGRAEALSAALADLPGGAAHHELEVFLEQIRPLTLGQWEELHTRTLDLNPLAAPYIGFQIWGESYKRGNFMAEMSRVLNSSGTELDGELPDHLVPVLRYLDAGLEPLPDLVQSFAPAVQKMRAALLKTEPGNPYLHLFNAILAVYSKE